MSAISFVIYSTALFYIAKISFQSGVMIATIPLFPIILSQFLRAAGMAGLLTSPNSSNQPDLNDIEDQEGIKDLKSKAQADKKRSKGKKKSN
jgi:hypothetical protein